MKRNVFCKSLALSPLVVIHGLVADENSSVQAGSSENEESLSERIDLAQLIWDNWNLGKAEGYSLMKFILRERGQGEKVTETRFAFVRKALGDVYIVKFNQCGKSECAGISVESIPGRFSEAAKKIVSFMSELYQFESVSDDFTVSTRPFYFRISLFDVQKGNKEIIVGRNDEGLSMDLILWLDHLRKFCNEIR